MTQPPKVFAPLAATRLGGTIGHGDFPNAVLKGSTTNFRVYVDPSVPAAAGNTIAHFVLSVCERDLTTIAGEFGGIHPPGTPYNVIIATSVGGAYHYGCAATDIYCGVNTTPSVVPQFTAF